METKSHPQLGLWWSRMMVKLLMKTCLKMKSNPKKTEIVRASSSSYHSKKREQKCTCKCQQLQNPNFNNEKEGITNAKDYVILKKKNYNRSPFDRKKPKLLKKDVEEKRTASKKNDHFKLLGTDTHPV